VESVIIFYFIVYLSTTIINHCEVMNIIDHFKDLVIIYNNYAPILKFFYLILSQDLKPNIFFNF